MWTPKILVLGPGGVRGCLELGALTALRRNNFLAHVETFVGVSIGAIISLLILSGYEPEEIVTDLADFDLTREITTTTFVEMKAGGGLIPTRFLRELITKRLKAKFGFVPIMSQIHFLTGKRFIAVTTDFESEQPVYISDTNFPDLSVVDACIMSSSIPLILHRVELDGRVYVDGALTDPYPVKLFDDGEREILGVRIRILQKKDNSISTFASKASQISINTLSNRSLAEASPAVRHLTLSTECVDTTGISMSSDEKLAMFVSGFDQANLQIQKWVKHSDFL